MIQNSPDNRRIINSYLDSLSEDNFIEDVIVPLFSRYGYRVYHIGRHGPGEHGKDAIFQRFEPLHLAEEFVAVQAKAERVTTSNVRDFANQIDRAMRVGFPRIAGGGQIHPHYVFFINSKTHTSDAQHEFMELVSDKNHTRIMSQPNCCDLIMSSGIVPRALADKLIINGSIDEKDINSRSINILLRDDPREVDHLLDHELLLLKAEVADRVKRLIIDFAKKKWDEDSSFSGLKRPMRWYNNFFDFISEDQCRYLVNVVEDYTSSNPSYAVAGDASAIINKLSATHITSAMDEFLPLFVKVILGKRSNWQRILKIFESIPDTVKSNDPILAKALNLGSEFRKSCEARDANLVVELETTLETYVYPQRNPTRS